MVHKKGDKFVYVVLVDEHLAELIEYMAKNIYGGSRPSTLRKAALDLADKHGLVQRPQPPPLTTYEIDLRRRADSRTG